MPDTDLDNPATADQAAITDQAQAMAERLSTAKQTIGKTILGQEQVIENTLVGLLCGGHVLLVGLPGLAKTKLVETLGTVLSLGARRVQFTPIFCHRIFSARKCWKKAPADRALFALSKARSFLSF